MSSRQQGDNSPVQQQGDSEERPHQSQQSQVGQKPVLSDKDLELMRQRIRALYE
jgi:hypothetical protein